MITRRASTGFVLSVTMACSFWAVQSSAQSGNDFDRGLAEFRAGNYSSAATLFAGAEAASPLRGYVRLHRDSSDALYMLGFVLNRENRPAESLAAYTQAAALVQPTSDDLKIVGLDYILLDDYSDAIKWLQKAVALDGTNRDAWYYLGRAYYTKARLIEARKAFQAILNLDPRDARAENNLGLIFETEGKPAEAIGAYRKAIAWQEQNSQLSEQPYVNLGNLLVEQGQIKEAIGPLEKAVALAPNSAFCHMTLGVYYRKSGQMAAARRELERATQLEPDNAIAHFQLGRFYKEIHDLDRAKMEFDRTAELQGRAAGSKPSIRNP